MISQSLLFDRKPGGVDLSWLCKDEGVLTYEAI